MLGFADPMKWLLAVPVGVALVTTIIMWWRGDSKVRESADKMLSRTARRPERPVVTYWTDVP